VLLESCGGVIRVDRKKSSSWRALISFLEHGAPMRLLIKNFWISGYLNEPLIKNLLEKVRMCL